MANTVESLLEVLDVEGQQVRLLLPKTEENKQGWIRFGPVRPDDAAAFQAAKTRGERVRISIEVPLTIASGEIAPTT